MLSWCHICSYYVQKRCPLYKIQFKFAVDFCLNGAGIKMQKYLGGISIRNTKHAEIRKICLFNMYTTQ